MFAWKDVFTATKVLKTHMKATLATAIDHIPYAVSQFGSRFDDALATDPADLVTIPPLPGLFDKCVVCGRCRGRWWVVVGMMVFWRSAVVADRTCFYLPTPVW